jgi:Phosphoribosylformimino-5-aminoimidazole carboxamide ribonucleotide (ProFAR) isomerase
MIQEFAIVPAVDVLDGRAVRLLRGDYDRVEVDAGDPLALVRQLAAGSPPLIHVVALGAARDGGPPVELARATSDAAHPFRCSSAAACARSPMQCRWRTPGLRG